LCHNSQSRPHSASTNPEKALPFPAAALFPQPGGLGAGPRATPDREATGYLVTIGSFDAAGKSPFFSAMEKGKIFAAPYNRPGSRENPTAPADHCDGEVYHYRREKKWFPARGSILS